MSDLPIKIGLNIVWAKPEHVIEFAQRAEALGFDSVWSGEHIGLPKTPDWWHGYPSAQAAREAGQPFDEDDVSFGPDSVFLDPMVVLAHVAAATSRVRLGIGIYLLALRDPILVGRTIASLDVLSGGRLDLGIGLGWTPAEYTYTHNTWEDRGRRLDEMVRCLRVLFEEDAPEFHGEFFDFPQIGFQPKPLQRPLPIHIGGGSPAALRRAARLGNGWYAPEAPELVPALRDELEKADRAGEKFDISMITLGGPISTERLEALAGLGVERVVVTPWPGRKVAEVGAEGLEELDRYAKEIGLV